MKPKNMLFYPVSFLKEILEKRYLIFELVKRDFKARYMGSVLGLFWAIFQPVFTMAVMWAVFSFGFKAGRGPGGVPFVVYLFTGNLAWDFFSSSVSSSTNVVREYSFLVKKMNFRMGILPVVKMFSALIINVIYSLFVMVILVLNGYAPDMMWFNVVYYFCAMFALTLALSWFFSAVCVFARDIMYVVNIVLQFGIWLTPVFWNAAAVPQKYHILIKLNPMAYIVNGYRDALVYHKGFWEADVTAAAIFWGFTGVMLLVGVAVFKKLRPNFADVL